MAGKKISELTQTQNITGEEFIVISHNGDNKKVQIKNIKGSDNLGEDYVDIVGDDGKEYRLKIVNGKAVVEDKECYTADAPADGDNQYYDGLIINQMYGGGSSTSTPVSHGFIELYNFTDLPINLKGIYLWYRSKSSGWQSLALEGIVPARHSFLIRCKQHTAPYSQGVRCNIVDYDMSWDIQLSNQGFSCYLAIGEETPEDNPVRQVKDAQGTVTSTNGKYIDLLGAGGSGGSEQTIWAYETRYLMCMDENTAVHRRDFANSGSKNVGSNALVKGFNDCDVEPIDYKTCNVNLYRPRCRKDGRWTEFYDKPKQKETSPSMINMAYGENGDTTRTFTFQTPLTDTGFVKYRKEGETKWTTVETNTEMCTNVGGDTTLHRCIIHDLTVGNYEYQLGTDGCSSDIYTFEIKTYGSGDTLRVLWTTDQQS